MKRTAQQRKASFSKRRKTAGTVVIPYQRRRLPSPEKKFLDTDLGTIGVVATTLERVNLNVVVQGDEEQNRNGRKIQVCDIYCKGTITLPPATVVGSSSDVVTCMIIQDTQTNGAQFAGNAFLQTDEWFSYRNLSNQERFKVLWKENLCLKAGGGTTDSSPRSLEDVVMFQCKRKVNIPILYDNTATTGAVDTQRSNSLHFCAISTSGLATLDGTARIRFLDY